MPKNVNFTDLRIVKQFVRINIEKIVFLAQEIMGHVCALVEFNLAIKAKKLITINRQENV